LTTRRSLGHPNGADYILNCAEADKNMDQLIAAVAPFGSIVSITRAGNVDTTPLFRKRGTLTFEFMFGRAVTGIEMEKQHHILNKLADLADKGIIPDRVTQTLSLKNDLATAHKQLESGTTMGKVVLTVDL